MSIETEITLELMPENRLDVINVHNQIPVQFSDRLYEYSKSLYYSYHTTAGYFGENLCAQLNHNGDAMRGFVELFQKLFPPKGGYRHDQLHLRTELSSEQRGKEPRNAHSHLTFMSCGLTNCAIYPNRPDTPVYFVDLDGIWNNVRRRRQTTVLGFNEEQVVAQINMFVPVSHHPIDSVNLKDPKIGFFPRLQELVEEHKISRGRIDIALGAGELNAGLTVNEYETLLMKHDLAEVLKNPLRFMAERGRNILEDPRAIPGKARDFAKYDLVRLLNEFVDALGLSESVFERLVRRFLAAPAGHFLGMDRSLSLLISNTSGNSHGSIVQGTYQSPILVQWDQTDSNTRLLKLSFVRFE